MEHNERTRKNMGTKIISIILVIVGIINFYPAIGVISAERLQSLYQLSFQEENLQILMRHRAILFGLLGAFLIYSAFRPSLQPLAFIAGFVSMIGFIVLTLLSGKYNSSISKVMVADIIASVVLAIAAVLHTINRSTD
jgi:hypothetical protein